VYYGFGALESPLRGFDLFTRDFRAALMSLELLQTGDNYFRQVALLVTIRNLDCLVEFALTQRAGYGRSKCAALLLGGIEGHQTIDHDADGPGRHKKHDDDDSLGEGSHLFPEVTEIPARSARFLQQHKRPNLHL
jgi:hypothetical protein